jgi:hypothetical protein|tara:strand:- start:2999 stop:3106 length:108 start_codon:yes stop_codon:yes gene_type:complete
MSSSGVHFCGCAAIFAERFMIGSPIGHGSQIGERM